MTDSADVQAYDVVVVGGGAAGVGVAITLMHAGIENYVVIERHSVDASFASWPEEARFITPSFLEVEHPTGKETRCTCGQSHSSCEKVDRAMPGWARRARGPREPAR